MLEKKKKRKKKKLLTYDRAEIKFTFLRLTF